MNIRRLVRPLVPSVQQVILAQVEQQHNVVVVNTVQLEVLYITTFLLTMLIVGLFLKP